MKTGVIVMNFGEPSDPSLERVESYLERIFLQNMSLEGGDAEARTERARELARTRASGLLETYEAIGGSPLNEQADAQAERLEEALRERGGVLRVYSAYQYTEPFIADGVARAREEGMERLVALPVYPLCGDSTTVRALQELRAEVDAAEGWDPDVVEISGWHLHPDFIPLWVDHVTRWCYDQGVDLHEDRVELVFSIHGTPIHYLEEGNRYDRYVDEACGGIAKGLGVPRYHMGYQNHTNRPISWTGPDVEDVVEGLDGRADAIVVVPVAFLHEQSETLAELDDELKEVAEAAGLGFYRVPVPHDSERLIELLADLVEAAAGMEPSSGTELELRRCLCRRGGTAVCTNGLRRSSCVEVEGIVGKTAGVEERAGAEGG